MKPKQYAAVVSALERIDRTGVAPELSGPIGRFFRSYAQHRLGIAQLSIAMGNPPGRDGVLRAGALGVATLRFLDDVAVWDETTTEFGVLYHVPALCDEFLSPITLRLWSRTGAGAEGLHSLADLRLRAQGVRLQGNFQWKPPSVLLPNTATFHVIDIGESPQWLGAIYLRYVGEDVGIDPHPLSYIPFATAGNRLFAALRIVAGVAVDSRTLVIPFATKAGVLKLRVRIDVASTSSARSSIEERRSCSWLVAREPDGADWVVLDACEATYQDLVLHSASWGAYLRALNADASIPSDARISQQTATNLHQIGLTGSLEAQPSELHQQGSSLALRIAEQMRFPDRRTGMKVFNG